jgi:hypothetical protein
MQLTNAMVVIGCIRQSSNSGGRTLAKELVNKAIVAPPLWKFDSGSRRWAVFWGIIEVSMQTPTLKSVCQVFRWVHACEMVGTFSAAGLSVGARGALRAGFHRALLVRRNLFRL